MARSKSSALVNIANGASLSGAVVLGDKVLIAIIVPAAWTAAALSFQASEDNGATFYDLFDATGTEVSILSASVVAGRRISIDPTAYIGVDCIKVRSGLTAAAVPQGAARTIGLISRKIHALD